MAMEVNLNFINRSRDPHPPDIVIFQINRTINPGEKPIAWRVIQNCHFGNQHPFNVPMELEIRFSDAFGNLPPGLPIREGRQCKVIPEISGPRLVDQGRAVGFNEVVLKNNLPKGSVDAHVYRGGKLLALKKCVIPMQKAIFSFPFGFCVVAVSMPPMREGQFLDDDELIDMRAEFRLTGVAGADLVMRGGGDGPDAAPYSFCLENIIRT